MLPALQKLRHPLRAHDGLQIHGAGHLRHARVDLPGVHDKSRHPAAADLGLELGVELDQGGLGRGVGGAERRGLHAGEAPHGDDGAGAARQHGRQRGVDERERGGEVEREDGVPGGEGGLGFEGVVAERAGVVDEDVGGAAEVAGYFLDDVRGGGRRGDVEGDGEGGDIEAGLYGGDHAVEIGLRAGDERDAGAGGGEGKGGGKPDAAAGAGDEDDFVGEGAGEVSGGDEGVAAGVDCEIGSHDGELGGGRGAQKLSIFNMAAKISFHPTAAQLDRYAGCVMVWNPSKRMFSCIRISAGGQQICSVGQLP